MKMKIPRCFHPILGVLIGAILFLIGIAVLSVAFVAAYRMVVFPDFVTFLLPENVPIEYQGVGVCNG